MTKTVPSRLTQAILETADGMCRVGVMTDDTHAKITLRHLGKQPIATPDPMSGEEIRSLRERERLSQAVFARYLNLTVGYVSQVERGAKQLNGPALVLLDVIRRKGIGAIL